MNSNNIGCLIVINDFNCIIMISAFGKCMRKIRGDESLRSFAKRLDITPSFEKLINTYKILENAIREEY